jgi:hypothetical protein
VFRHHQSDDRRDGAEADEPCCQKHYKVPQYGTFSLKPDSVGGLQTIGEGYQRRDSGKFFLDRIIIISYD